MNVGGLTALQRDCLEFIAAYADDNRGISPSYAEIMRHMGFRSRSNVARLIDGLEQRGFVRRRPYLARGVEIIRSNDGRMVQPIDPDVLAMAAAAAAKCGQSLKEYVEECIIAMAQIDLEEGR